jgi:hypothetical protein
MSSSIKFQLVVFSAAAAVAATLGAALPSFARPATLVAIDPGSQINVRTAPTTTARTPHYGYAGDRVEVLRHTVGSDQYGWNYVEFASGAKGWVRGDFVRYNEDYRVSYGMLNGQPGDRINVRTAPSLTATAPSYGLQGDVVKILDQADGRDGYVWMYVQFPSGAQGWVRGDLVSRMDEGGC